MQKLSGLMWGLWDSFRVLTMLLAVSKGILYKDFCVSKGFGEVWGLRSVRAGSEVTNCMYWVLLPDGNSRGLLISAVCIYIIYISQLLYTNLLLSGGSIRTM